MKLDRTNDRPVGKTGLLLRFPGTRDGAEVTPAEYPTARPGGKAMNAMWTRFDLRSLNSPALAGLPTEAKWLWVQAMTYAGDHETDGHLTHAQFHSLRVPHPTRNAERLVEAGVWRLTPTGFYIEAWRDHCLSKAEIQARKAGTRARVANWRAKASR